MVAVVETTSIEEAIFDIFIGVVEGMTIIEKTGIGIFLTIGIMGAVQLGRMKGIGRQILVGTLIVEIMKIIYVGKMLIRLIFVIIVLTIILQRLKIPGGSVTQRCFIFEIYPWERKAIVLNLIFDYYNR